MSFKGEYKNLVTKLFRSTTAAINAIWRGFQSFCFPDGRNQSSKKGEEQVCFAEDITPNCSWLKEAGEPLEPHLPATPSPLLVFLKGFWRTRCFHLLKLHIWKQRLGRGNCLLKLPLLRIRNSRSSCPEFKALGNSFWKNFDASLMTTRLSYWQVQKQKIKPKNPKGLPYLHQYDAFRWKRQTNLRC